MTSYELVTAHTHSWPGSIMTSFHPFSSWKEVDSELQTSFWWPCQQSLMSPVPGYDFVAGSGQQRNEGNVNPVLPKTESNPPWHQNSSPGEYSSEWFLLLSTFSTNFLQFQHLDKSVEDRMTLWRLQEGCWTRTKQESELYVTKITAGDTWMEEVLGRPKKEYVRAHVCTPHRSVWTHPLTVYLKCTNSKKMSWKKEF